MYNWQKEPCIYAATEKYATDKNNCALTLMSVQAFRRNCKKQLLKKETMKLVMDYSPNYHRMVKATVTESKTTGTV